ncbi:MAG: hypothetical protein HRT47_04715 [Candidatus Caenarcaniphilales bacterium]|nr:hypothetical protein [Candidatus Caenarcaniphilales bacterium]
MVLEKLNLGPLKGKQLDQATKKAQAIIDEDNKKIEADEGDDRTGTIASTLKNLVGLNNSTAIQIAVKEEKRKTQDKDKRHNKAKANILRSAMSYIPNFDFSSVEAQLTSLTEVAKSRLATLSSGRYFTNIIESFFAGRQVNELA